MNEPAVSDEAATDDRPAEMIVTFSPGCSESRLFLEFREKQRQRLLGMQ